MRRFEVLLRTPGPDGRPGRLRRHRQPAGIRRTPARAAAIVAASDARDARPVDVVRAEVRRRAGGDDEVPPKNADVAGAAQPDQQRAHQT